MTTIVTRAGKGTALTWTEADDNFTNLKATADSALTAATTTFTDVAIGVVPASGGGTTNYLRADGTFAAPPGTGASPGGADTQVQFNDGGSFGGDSVLTWNKTTNVLSVDRVVVTPTSANDGIAITGAAASVGLKITQGATAGTALSMYDDTAVGYINIQPGATTGNIVSNKQINFYVNTKYPLVLDTNANIGAGSVTSVSTWGSAYNAFEMGRVGNALMFGNAGANSFITTNAYYNGSVWKYANNTSAAGYLWLKDGGGFEYAYAAAGTAGNTITFSSIFSVDTAGSVTIAGASIPQNSQSVAYTLVAADANKHILHPSADTTARVFTIPANASVPFAIGTAVTFVNQASAGVITIAITTDTMRLAGAGTTGSRTLAANGIATALKITSTEWIISGTGLT